MEEVRCTDIKGKCLDFPKRKREAIWLYWIRFGENKCAFGALVWAPLSEPENMWRDLGIG